MSQKSCSCVTSVVLVGSLERLISNMFIHSGEILRRIDALQVMVMFLSSPQEMAQLGFCATTCSSAFTSEQVCTTEDSARFKRQGSDAL